jgi:hypothetical protein
MLPGNHRCVPYKAAIPMVSRATKTAVIEAGPNLRADSTIAILTTGRSAERLEEM